MLFKATFSWEEDEDDVSAIPLEAASSLELARLTARARKLLTRRKVIESPKQRVGIFPLSANCKSFAACLLLIDVAE